MAQRAVAVIVAGQAAFQPDRLFRPQKAGHFRLHPAHVGMGVAALPKLDRFGQQDRAFAIDMNAATFVHQKRGDDGHARDLRHKRRKPTVVLCTGRDVPAPGVEDPVDGGDGPIGGMDKGRPCVAHPVIVDDAADLFDAAPQHVGGALGFRGVDDHGDRFKLGNRMGDGGPGGIGGFAFGQRLIGPGAGEGHPDPVLRGGFGGHGPGHLRSFAWAVAKDRRRGRDCQSAWLPCATAQRPRVAFGPDPAYLQGRHFKGPAHARSEASRRTPPGKGASA